MNVFVQKLKAVGIKASPQEVGKAIAAQIPQVDFFDKVCAGCYVNNRVYRVYFNIHKAIKPCIHNIYNKIHINIQYKI